LNHLTVGCLLARKASYPPKCGSLSGWFNTADEQADTAALWLSGFIPVCHARLMMPRIMSLGTPAGILLESHQTVSM